jgi:NADPH:quinone reductase-like Zn-dependent oxidoreductase
LLSARWAGVIDSVGGGLLAHALAAVKPEGVVAALGNAGGGDLPTTVMPFILRGVKLLGINANSPMPLRRAVWHKLAREYRPGHLGRMTHTIELAQVPEMLQSMLDRAHIGRTVVRLF